MKKKTPGSADKTPAVTPTETDQKPAATPGTESEKRPRGRPRKEAGADEPLRYNHVLFRGDIRQLVGVAAPVALNEEQRRQRTEQYRQKLTHVLDDDAAAEYYWRLVFTYTFYLYRSRLQTQAVIENGKRAKLPVIKLRDMATHAQIDYGNMRNLFLGRGSFRNIFQFLRFLYEQSIDFNQIQYHEGIVDRAYAFLTNPEQITSEDDTGSETLDE